MELKNVEIMILESILSGITSARKVSSPRAMVRNLFSSDGISWKNWMIFNAKCFMMFKLSPIRKNQE